MWLRLALPTFFALASTLFLMGLGGGCSDVWDIPEAHLVDASSDVQVDAGVSDGSADVSFCKGLLDALSPPKLCSDFDEKGVDASTGWDNALHNPDPGLNGGGSWTIDPSLAFSPPASLAVTTPTLAAFGAAGAFLLKDLPSTPDLLEISEAVNLSSLDIPQGNGGAVLIGVLLSDGMIGDGASFVLGSAGTAVNVRAQGVTNTTFLTDTATGVDISLPTKTWVQIAFSLTNATVGDAGDASGPIGSAYVMASWPPNVTAVARVSFPYVPPGTGLTVIVGAETEGPIDKLQMNVDNVVVRY